VYLLLGDRKWIWYFCFENPLIYCHGSYLGGYSPQYHVGVQIFSLSYKVAEGHVKLLSAAGSKKKHFSLNGKKITSLQQQTNRCRTLLTWQRHPYRKIPAQQLKL